MGFAAADCTGDAVSADDFKTAFKLSVDEWNAAVKPGLDTCAALTDDDKTAIKGDAAYMKVTCTATALTVGYFSDDKCETAAADVADGDALVATATLATLTPAD